MAFKDNFEVGDSVVYETSEGVIRQVLVTEVESFNETESVARRVFTGKVINDLWTTNISEIGKLVSGYSEQILILTKRKIKVEAAA